MAFDPAVAVFDACILYPFHLRNIVIQAAADDLIEARWTDEIHDEWVRNVASARDVSMAKLQRLRQFMNETLPAATVIGY